MNKVHGFCSQSSIERVVVLDIEHTCTNDDSIPREERETKKYSRGSNKSN